MSHLNVNSILPADAYNYIIIDHGATERAQLLDLKHKHLPALHKILIAHGLEDFVELHLLYRHFILREAEAVVHRTLEIPESGDLTGVCVDVAKAVKCPVSIKSSLVPLLWMASSNGSLVAYEYGLRESADTSEPAIIVISAEKWNSFTQEFSAYVHSAGIADIVSLKDKSCISEGEYVVPGMRVLFRVPTEVIKPQPGTGVLESGWKFDAAVEPDASFPECTDGHVTKSRKTTGGTVAHYHVTTEDGIDAFNEIPLLYTKAMWNAAKSKDFCALNNMVGAMA